MGARTPSGVRFKGNQNENFEPERKVPPPMMLLLLLKQKLEFAAIGFK